MINRVTWDNDVLTMKQLLEYTASRYEEKAAIKYVDENDSVISKSFRKLRNDSVAMSCFLKKQSAAARHIALVAKTNYNYIVAMNGIMAAGDIAVPLSYDLTEDQLVTILEHSDAEVVFYDDYSSERVAKAIGRLGDRIVSYSLNRTEFFDEITENYSLEDDAILTEMNPDDDTVMIYTSGTTGVSKGARLSARAMISNIYFKEMNFEGDNVALNVLPMHHIFCFSCDYLKNLKDGVTICLNGDIQNIGKNLLRFEPSVVRMVPMIVESLAKKISAVKRKHPEFTPRQAAEQVFGSRIQMIIVSGAAFVASIADDFEEMGIMVRQGYGMTETGPRISVPDGKTCAASGGRVISLCEIRLGENDEIQVRSPSVMSGYYKMPEETEKVFTEDGWFRTGDIGRLTEDRELFITGRLKNIIILSNGENVSPEEIEKRLSADPVVKELIVYGKKNILAADIHPDYEYAQKNGVEDADEYIRQLVDDYNHNCEAVKSIGIVNVVAEPLPRTSTGKIIRNKN